MVGGKASSWWPEPSRTELDQALWGALAVLCGPKRSHCGWFFPLAPNKVDVRGTMSTSSPPCLLQDMAECYSLSVGEGTGSHSLVVIKRFHDSRWYVSLRQAFHLCGQLGDRSSWGAFYKRVKKAPRAVVEEATKLERDMLVRHGALSPLAPGASLVSAATLLVVQRDAYALPPALGTALASLVHGTAQPTPLGPQQVCDIDIHGVAVAAVQELADHTYWMLTCCGARSPAGPASCRRPVHPTTGHPPTHPLPTCASI